MYDSDTVAELVAEALGRSWRSRTTRHGQAVMEGPNGEELTVELDENRVHFTAVTWLVPHQRPYSRHGLSVRRTATPEVMAAELETRLLADYRLRHAEARRRRGER